jgi:beta-lactamase class A
MHETIQRLIGNLRGVAGLYVEDLTTGRTFQHNAHVPFPAASLIKLPILWEYFYQVEHGKLSPDQLFRVPGEAIVGGYGVIKDLGPGALLRYKDLATLMIVLSDNTATNLLIDILGLQNISSQIRALALQETELQRRLFDFAKIEEGLDNYTSPADVARLLTKMVRGDGLSRQACDEMIAILEKQHYRGKLPARLPPDARVANKTGEVSGVEHDAAIFFRDGRVGVVAALTKELPEKEAGVEFCQQIGWEVYSWLGEQDGDRDGGVQAAQE